MNIKKLQAVKLDLKKEKKNFGKLYPQNFIISTLDLEKDSIEISKEEYMHLTNILKKNRTDYLLDEKSNDFYTIYDTDKNFQLLHIKKEYCKIKRS